MITPGVWLISRSISSRATVRSMVSAETSGINISLEDLLHLLERTTGVVKAEVLAG